MNYLLSIALVINIYCFINGMTIPQTISSIWVITQDGHRVEIDTAIAQQSNLLSFLQEKYPGTQENPIPIPIDQKHLSFFCKHLATPAQQLSKELDRQDYSNLMDIADQLKCLLLYAELMQPIIPTKDLIVPYVFTITNCMLLLKKVTYKHFLEKKCIKKCKNHVSNDINLSYSQDGRYFLENISRDHVHHQVNLWDTEKKCCIKTFEGYNQALLSPSNNYIILYKLRSNEFEISTMDTAPVIYSIAQGTSIPLLNNYTNYSWYTPTIAPNESYIMQKRSRSYSDEYILVHYIEKKNEIQEIPLDDKIRSFDFDPDTEHMFYISGENRIMKCEIKNPENKKIIEENPEQYAVQPAPYFIDIKIDQSGSLLMVSIKNEETKLFFTIEDEKLILKKKIYSDDNCYDLQDIFISHKKIHCYNQDRQKLSLIDENNNNISWCTKEIGPRIARIIADTTGNHIVSLHKADSNGFVLSKLAFWNISDFPHRITKNIPNNIKDVINDLQFTDGGLLLTQGIKTELWDTHGDKVLNCGHSQQYALHSACESILMAKSMKFNLGRGVISSVSAKTKLYLVHPQREKVLACLNNIQNSLTLSEILLFDAHCSHRKDKKRMQLYPHLPDGRALASFSSEHAFLTKKFKLSKNNLIPINPLIVEQKMLPHEQF